jgi:hypothetical protein
MLAQEIAAGNRQRLHERVAAAEDDLRHQAPERVQPHNLQLVRRWLINVPARVVHRARQVFVRLAAGMLWREVFKRTYDRLTQCRSVRPDWGGLRGLGERLQWEDLGPSWLVG